MLRRHRLRRARTRGNGWRGAISFAGRSRSRAPENRRPRSSRCIWPWSTRPDGTIIGYRDGKPYGQPYKSDGPLRFEPGQSHVVFGLRHAPAGGNKMLQGKILQAQLVRPRPAPEEVAASAGPMPDFVSEAAVLAALSAAEPEAVELA